MAAQQTTFGQSIETLDGYVSRGSAPSQSVSRDYAMLQEFTEYLELRLYTKNLWMLRRIFADFLTNQEDTLVAMMQQGCTIVTVFPKLRTSGQRLQTAKVLLAKPKFPLEAGKCVFFFLHHRTATRNMALFNHFFLDFVSQQEKFLMDFVERGCEVISVIPFQLPQNSTVVNSVPEQESSRVSDNEEQVTSEVAEVKKVKKRRVHKAQVAQKRASGRARDDSEAAASPVVPSDDMYVRQLELTLKMKPIEAQIPWEVVYAKLLTPFDEAIHPELSQKYREFWRKHARAVWERNFWAPLPRKVNMLEFSRRNSRQLKAKDGFEAIIVAAYEELGAAFFVMLDSLKSRHPGWWYRRPIVSLFALQQIKGEKFVWGYVRNQALKRFPDCKLPLPLKAPNAGSVLKRHPRVSESMWMPNHRLTPTILNAVTALKAKLQTEDES